MININKNTKIYIIYFITLVLAIASWQLIVEEMNAEVSMLEVQVEDLQIQNSKLSRQNTIYQEVIETYKENEDNFNNEIELLQNDVTTLKKERDKLNKTVTPSRSGKLRGTREFTVTCYDLSVKSCGKAIGTKGYGITASGVSLIGNTWETARAIAVDSKVIPLGSKVEITFTNENYSKYNGIYTAVDKGGAVKGNKIDFFLGDFNQNEEHPSVGEFGKTKANVRIID